ncbi:hypothetical protein EST38_g6827 [Candolleomyces aberdarensis]|uniref:Uncharacterized protein n=1 Tax=Candolleomyces aberdarensis TaxID=2316362 RepID=A0A4Q2DGV6_9AGAR|nr:hypothetical protein EST38_g6827 [Candolleomyces aberdarensis]
MGDAIICGYTLDHERFHNCLIPKTPGMREFLPSCGDATVRVYDRWRAKLPRQQQNKAPKVRCKGDADCETPVYLFATRHIPYKNRRQLKSLRTSPSGFLKETERDKAKLRLWISFIKDEGGPVFAEEEFQFDWTVDEDPSLHDY